jgi:hypothetical protein
VQLVEAVRNVRVVLEHAGVLCQSPAPAAEEPALRRRQRPEEELRERMRSFEVVGPVEAARRLGERREREPVP